MWWFCNNHSNHQELAPREPGTFLPTVTFRPGQSIAYVAQVRDTASVATLTLLLIYSRAGLPSDRCSPTGEGGRDLQGLGQRPSSREWFKQYWTQTSPGALPRQLPVARNPGIAHAVVQLCSLSLSPFPFFLFPS